MKYIDESTWERKELVEKYDDYVFPYINLGADLDVTGLYHFVKKNQLSFYCAMTHTAVRAALEFKNFSYRLVDGAPVLCEKLDPVITHKAKDSENFLVIHGDYCEDMENFCVQTAEKMKREEQAAHGRVKLLPGDSVEILYISCIPWVKYTHFVRTIQNPKTDNIPRLSWGKYEEDEKGRIWMPFSVQVHHALMDGYHVGIYMQRVQEMLDEF